MKELIEKQKRKDYNRNFIGGKRPHRGISRSYRGVNIQYLSLLDRLIFETKVLNDYLNRVKK